MKIRQRNKNLLYAGLIGALSIALISAGILYFMYKNMKESEELLIQQYEEELEEFQIWADQQVKAFTANRYIEAGETIEENDLREVLLSAETAAEDITHYDELLGSIAKVNLEPRTVLTDSILYFEERTPRDLRLAEYAFIDLPSRVEVGDFVDVRIQFPNGNDYVLLSKKKVKELNEDVVWYEMNEQELLTISSAIVDAYLENAIIYALAYVEPYVQDESVVTYPVKDNVLELIETSPNIVDRARNELEARNRQKLENQLEELESSEREKYQRESEKEQEARANRQQEVFEAVDTVNLDVDETNDEE
ncbi:SAF domain protein (plasmid) [Alkalihalophilus pseudofirmus OF4]|uniref:SAF domain protein n=1 Tax=Alkalihalophilus pseudofirmus (strain ATCC BAA-2126 / JCM 17055 / OF4) TaxID=398511 RepID=D3G1J0_ALKPO|nr:SAF domain-containing protein [Alkalihalophilus pseudofirmus]ADC52216.1 SAF domain protein [Alkalihalophilus pseudofirmus OF4]